MVGAIFYVYEHWRPDTGTCFWVGKGHGRRAWEMRRRNRHHRHIVQKLHRFGLKVTVKIVRASMNESEALALEIKLITAWRSTGADLANVTGGGEGTSGLRHSEETRAVIREKRQRQVIHHSEDTRHKIGAANSIALKGRKNPEHGIKMRGRKLAPDHRAKIVAKLMGRPVSAETRAKMRASNIGQKRSKITRDRLREAHLGKRPTMETREKMSIAQSARWNKIKAEAQLCLL